MPMTLTGLDMHDIANGDLALLRLSRGKALARRDDEDLIAIMHMPPGGRAGAEVHHVTAKVIGLPVADDRLPRPAHRPAGPAGDRRRRVHRFFFEFTDFEYAHT